MENVISIYRRQQEESLGKKIQKVCHDTIASWKENCIENEADKEFIKFISQRYSDEYVITFCKNNNITYTRLNINRKDCVCSLRLIFQYFNFRIDLFQTPHSISGDFNLDFKDENLSHKYFYYIANAQNHFYRGWGSFLMSFIKNISTGEEALFNAIQELLKKYDEDYLNKTAKTKEIVAKSMESLCNSVLNKTGYSWELTITKGSVHRLQIQIEGNRYLTVQVKEKEFVSTISRLLSVISDLKEFEKKYNTKIDLQRFVPSEKNQKLSNSVIVR